jgi:saccharopine dehydrogenase-like NADP-dependent oxidoreductase
LEKDLTIVDYDEKKAKEIGEKLGIKYQQCDVADTESLDKLLQGSEVVINCVQYNWNIKIMEACLRSHSHYIDLGGLFHTTKKQFVLHEQFKDAGLIAVLGMGSTPGTTNVMAGYAASQLDTISDANIYCGCGDFTKTEAVIGIPYSLLTIFEEHTKEPWILKDGELTSVPVGSGRKMISFSEPIGLAEGMYCIHSEPAQFQRSFNDKGIQNASFTLSLPKESEERISFLAELGFASDEVNPLHTTVAVVNRYLENYDATNDGELNDCDVLRAEVKGLKDGVEKEIVVETIIRTSKKWGFMAGALDTGVPPSIVAQMIINGDITETGVCAPEQCVPPVLYFKEIGKREMAVYSMEKTPLSDNDFKKLNDVMSREK